MSRPATHAGTWYEKNPTKLGDQIRQWLQAAETSVENHSRYAIGPHAGYRFCGHVLAHTYAQLDRSIDRIVLMGPSHFKYFKGIQTSKFTKFDTPLGTLNSDQKAVSQLSHACGLEVLDDATDLKEHSWEMHLPFIASVSPHAKIVPLLFGAFNASQTSKLVNELARFGSENTAVVVSSDFCHWGSYFDYMPFKSSGPLIYKQIDALDHEAIAILNSGSSASEWVSYIKRTGNTICGATPIRVMLMLIEQRNQHVNFTEFAYDQSSQVRNISDSSVSYAALAG